MSKKTLAGFWTLVQCDRQLLSRDSTPRGRDRRSISWIKIAASWSISQASRWTWVKSSNPRERLTQTVENQAQTRNNSGKLFRFSTGIVRFFWSQSKRLKVGLKVEIPGSSTILIWSQTESTTPAQLTTRMGLRTTYPHMSLSRSLPQKENLLSKRWIAAD